LYRAIDSAGATIDFLLSAFRDADAAKRLFRKALGDRSHPQPRVINTDLAPIYTCAIPDSKKEGTMRNRCRDRTVQYLNNILEQDHRAIKRRVNAKQGLPRISGGSANDSRLRSSPHDPEGASSMGGRR
jgi:transposase-like protein